jgi:GPH family glycoside/pentoside/hexuronide:cation symporter
VTSPTEESADPLRTSTILWYALPGAGALFNYTLIIVIFMKFCTDTLGVEASAVGRVMLMARVWDAVSDPLAGYLSDRTTLRFGRRKTWLLASSLPLALFSAMLWAPPLSFDNDQLMVWIAVAVVGFYTAYTIFEVPHLALGAELTTDPTQRNRVYGYRQLLKSGGLLLAFTVGMLSLDSANARENGLAVGVGAGLFAAITVIMSVWVLPRERQDYSGRGPSNPFKALRDVWQNRLARLVLIAYFVEALGMGGIGVLTPYVVEYVLEMPGQAAAFLGVYSISAIVAIPLWIKLGDRFEKRRLWMFGMGSSAIGFGLVVFLGPGAWLILGLSSLIAGSANACGSTIGVSLKADLIDVDELQTGERKEGAYFAAWNFVSKLAGGVMLWIVGEALSAIDFVPNAVQTETVRGWMLFLMGGIPMIGFAIGMTVFSRFDMTQADHAEIRAEIDARAAEARS